METLPPPYLSIDLSTSLYFQVVHTLTNLLPPPLDDSPQALHVRNRAAIAKVAALLPVNADEVDLAAQCIAARAQAEDILRLLRQHANDIAWVTRLNAQYGSMVRTSLAVHGRLMRVQALRQKREATGGATDQDAWTRHVAEQSTLAVLDPGTTPFKPAWPAEARPSSPEGARPSSPERARPSSPEGARPSSPEGARPSSPEGAPVETRPKSPAAAPANRVNQRIEKPVSEDETNSQPVAFETLLSEQPWNQGGPSETVLKNILREAMAKARKADPELTATSRESPSMAA